MQEFLEFSLNGWTMKSLVIQLGQAALYGGLLWLFVWSLTTGGSPRSTGRY